MVLPSSSLYSFHQVVSSPLQFHPCIRQKYLKTFFDLVTLTSELDLDILALDLHTKFQVCPFKQESGNRHSHAMSKLLHMSLMRGVIRGDFRGKSTNFLADSHPPYFSNGIVNNDVM